MMRRRKKPRDYAADVVRGEIVIEAVPDEVRHYVEYHIRAVADQIEAARKRKPEKRQ